MSVNRTTLKHGSITARHRQNRAARLTRHSCFTLKRPTIFHLRKSLVDYVDEELRDMETSVFYQRIFILAKNIHPGQRQSKSMTAPPFVNASVTQEPADEARASVNTQGTLVGSAGAESTEAGQGQEATTEGPALVDYADEIPPDGEESTNGSSPPLSPVKTMVLNDDEIEAEGRGNSETSAAAQNVAGDVDNIETLTHTYRFDEEENSVQEDEGEEEPEVEQAEEPNMSKDFYALFNDRLHELHKKCLSQTFTPDPMCGLFLYMGDYSMLMLETGEDMMGVFCRELANCSSEFWSSNRVFMIEDHIKDLYTKGMISRRIPAAFINEKFPTSTPTDEYLMGKQHMIIKEKLLTICRMITESMQQDPHFDLFSQNSSDDDDDIYHHSITNTLIGKSAGNASDALPVDTYRKLLPEIQRIDLVLSSTRFYYTLSEFTDIYGQSPCAPDDDSLFWPIQNQYTPPNIFMRTPFDINMTFADYAAEMLRRKHEEELQQQMLQPSVEEAKPPEKSENNEKITSIKDEVPAQAQVDG